MRLYSLHSCCGYVVGSRIDSSPSEEIRVSVGTLRAGEVSVVNAHAPYPTYFWKSASEAIILLKNPLLVAIMYAWSTDWSISEARRSVRTAIRRRRRREQTSTPA